VGSYQNIQEVIYNNEITVELIKHSAQDSDVVFAARVSTQGERSLVETSDSETQGLINFLMRERHGSPFEHSYFTFFVKAPIFVWREHMRHRIASYNEESGRYKVLAPEFYVPSTERKLQQVGKTGAYEFVEGTTKQKAYVMTYTKIASEKAYDSYQEMLDVGVAKEVARMVLPVNIYSSAYVTMNARALMNFLSLRKSAPDSAYPSYPQREIEMVAEQYEAIFAELMPITYKAFIINGRVAP
jgi:thymidylate synthase (FAD)